MERERFRRIADQVFFSAANFGPGGAGALYPNRQALHIEIDTSITSARLVRIFKRLHAEHGLPQVLRTDNGPEFLGEVLKSCSPKQK